MVSVLRVHLPSEIPVVGCEITPYVLLKRPDRTISNEDVPEAAPVGGCYIRYKWYRIQSDKKVAVCSIHPTELATLQCHHLILHDRASSAVNENGNDEEELFGQFSSGISVGHSRTYTPTADDIGHVLKFECVPVDAETRIPVGNSSTVTMSRHTTSDIYSYCPSWALAWSYRRQNLLKEIVSYHADIICLQEVQSNHFEEFFSPELDKHGYQALFKKKTTEVCNGNPNRADGCATFFRRDRFSHVKKYEVEFNKAAQSLTEAVIQPGQKKLALSRLIKDNIALIVVLEAKFSNNGAENSGKKQLLCVANTHVNVHHDHKDVKLWQVHTLLKGLEKIAVSADIPMLVCGDFNSVPGSASHALLATGKVDQLHPDLAVDPLGILRPPNKLNHQLPLVSAYSSFARMAGLSSGLELQRRKMDPTTHEPLFTNCTRDFIGTLDYIFYTADSLTVESLLELLDEDSIRKDTALPSPEWSSDHIALLAEFRCNHRTRRGH
ncbi:hypothetical protein HPP92_018487 [Vanilla planifolia]|uniref:poly(A)-specific ribonuclease n=1 Tax=Vanilla planifolia TaxID=51239 RepID=A0A835QCX8_VANPL|nr:hypothetical protein HPP92_018487 [Vanilla planifolia]